MYHGQNTMLFSNQCCKNTSQKHFFFLRKKYSRTCNKWSPLGQRKLGLIRQVVS